MVKKICLTNIEKGNYSCDRFICISMIEKPTSYHISIHVKYY